MATIRKKLVLVGDGSSGRSSMMLTFANGKFTAGAPDYHGHPCFNNTIPVGNVTVDGVSVELALWDTGGQEDYDRSRKYAYPDTDVILVCYAVDDLSNRLDNVTEKWVPEVRHFCPDVPILLVGMKTDLRNDPKTIAEHAKYSLSPITFDEAAAEAKEINAYAQIECSALENEGVQEVFEAAARASLTAKDLSKLKRDREKADALYTSLVKLVDADKLAAFAKKAPTIGQQFVGNGPAWLLGAIFNRFRPDASKHGGHAWLAAAARLPVGTSLSVAGLLSTAGHTNRPRKCLQQHLDEPLEQLVLEAQRQSKSAKDEGSLDCVTRCLSDDGWWYARAAIDPVVTQYGKTLQQEVEGADLAHHQARAREVMIADNRIYSEIHDKEKKKPKYAELAALSKESATRFNKKGRPSQPVDDGVDIWTVSQAKGHAAAANAPYRTVIDDIAHVTGLEEDAKTIPSMKRSFRIAQKGHRFKKGAKGRKRGDCRWVCDINRALLEARDAETALKILQHILGRKDITILFWKDRLNDPTEGGWCDVLIMFVVVGTNRHVNELQIGFKSMVANRKGGEAHEAYADGRDSIEIIEAAGGDFIMGDIDSQNKTLRDELTSLRHESEEQLTAKDAKIAAKDAKIAALEKKNQMLEKQLAAMTSHLAQFTRQQQPPPPGRQKPGPQSGASRRRPSPAGNRAAGPAARLPAAAAAATRASPSQPKAEAWEQDDRNADPDELRRLPRGQLCTYTAQNGRTCMAQAVGGAPQCRNHTCQSLGCIVPKSSRVEYCVEHDDSAA